MPIVRIRGLALHDMIYPGHKENKIVWSWNFVSSKAWGCNLVGVVAVKAAAATAVSNCPPSLQKCIR